MSELTDQGLHRADTTTSAATPLSAPVKLIVWDLDDTLWTGALCEGPVVLEQSRVDLIRALNRRGIVNSICSKNEAGAVQRRLEMSGLWDEFVFARIDWSPKGARVAQIIQDAQLRPENVLFIDDLPLNREEVRHFAPGIQVADPTVIDGLLTRPELAGKDDGQLSRLHQYRTLERRTADRQATSESNESFLRSCDIRVLISEATVAEAERLFELANRTNQLNFTKRRPEWDDFVALLADPGTQSKYIEVRDRYGDHGVCGFYTLSDGVLTDFLFSCRVLNMGVEQWVYDHLGRPELTIVGEVASTLDSAVDWITVGAEASTTEPVPSDDHGSGHAGSGVQPARILIVGGCDLLATAQFLGGDIATDFHRVSASGAPVHAEHTEILRQAVAGLAAEQRAVVDRLPFLDDQAFAPRCVMSPDYDVLVYSALVDYSQGMYRHRQSGLVVTWCQYSRVVTDPASWAGLEADFGHCGIDRSFLEWFAAEFESIGCIAADRFEENIRWLSGSVPAGARLIVLNGTEVAVDNPNEPGRHLRHVEMNAALDNVVPQLTNTTLLDVRRFITTQDDLVGNVRHYRRQHYLRIAEEIRSSGAATVRIRRDSSLRQVGVWLRKRAGPLRHRLTGRR